MKTYFSVPLVMLFAICALVVFYEHSDAGTPAVYPYATASSYRAKAKISCGIEGKLKNKESYSGSASCTARITDSSGTESKSKSAGIWAEVYRDGWWPFGKLRVRKSSSVSVVVLKSNATSAYAYASGSLGSAEADEEAIYD
jgi:hypothetical protein